MKERNLSLALIFIDFSKAFDSVHRDRMFAILAAYGIPDTIISAIRLIYDDSEAIVITPDGETDLFRLLAGVFQGDTLAPFLFIVVLDYAMRQALKKSGKESGVVIEPRRSRRHPEVRLNDAAFADDIGLLADTLKKAERLLHSVEEAANLVGLHVNAKKTETLLINLPTAENAKTLKGEELKNVKSFKYLGSHIPDSMQDFKIRKAVTWRACNKLDKVWRSDLSRRLKLKLFRACVESILLYGSETWTVTKQLQNRLDGCYTLLLRRVLNVSCMARQANKSSTIWEYSTPVSHNTKEATEVCWALCSCGEPTLQQSVVLDT